MTGCLAEVRALVRQEAGIVLPARRHGPLRAALRRVAPGLDPCAFARAAAPSQPGGRELIDQLVDEITIQESSFFRDRVQFDVIDWRALRDAGLADGADLVRVWITGCAHGEEAYTLALLAAEAFAPEPPPVCVLGTDISRAAVDVARAGRYGARAVRAVGTQARQRHFEAQPDGTYLVGADLRAMVRFGRHNLARDPFPPPGESAFDLIACRNVLIYLDAPLAQQVIDSLERSLRPGGVLLLGAADSLHRAVQAPGEPQALTVPRPRSSRPADGVPPPGSPRRPLGRPDGASRDDRLATALDAAGRGDRELAQAQVASLLAADPVDAEVQFVQGLIALEAGDPGSAVVALRRALYAEAKFALAAFTLGRAYDALGDAPAARRAYRQTLRCLDPADQRHELMLKHIDIGDIAAACRTRLSGGQT